jgi:GT2 family glycosyltransferase
VTEIGTGSEVETGAGGVISVEDPPRMSAGAGAVARPPASTSTLAVSVVVCSYTEDRWDDLTRAVASLREQSVAPLEIILVVDHCPGLLRRAMVDLPGTIIVPNRLAPGLAGARNTGVSGAQGDIVAFLDDDAAADPEWVARLTERYQDPQVLGVGGLVSPDWEEGRPGWFPPELDWVVGCTYQGMGGLGGQGGQVRNFIGANMSFRREVLADVGGFSTSLGRVGTTPLGCEETELCLRVGRRYPDRVLLHEPAAAVRHRVGARRARWRYLTSRCYAEGLSKAMVARLAGTSRALASERSYVRSTIPRGVARSLGRAARGKLSGLGSAAALVLAVLITAVGYAVGRLAARADSPTTDAPSRASRSAVSALAAGAPWAGLAGAVTLWAVALAATDATRVENSGLGLVTVLSVSYWAALALLVASFTWAVARRASRWPVLAAHTVLLVVILHATPAILYQTLRYSWAWKHVGVIDYIFQHGIDFRLGGIFGPYQGWPGFFALNSFLLHASGQASALSYANWALPLIDLLWLGPVILIARAFTADQRLIWTAAWLFALGNWVGQDYFSPQGFTYFLYLTVVAVCVRWLRDRRPAPTTGPVAFLRTLPGRLRLPGGDWPRPAVAVATKTALPPGSAGRGRDFRSPRSAGTRWLMLIFLLPLMAAIASSHQLTPFMLIAALGLLVVFRRARPWFLPVVMGVITVGWIVYGGLPWLLANSSLLFEGIGLPWANTSAHLVGGTGVPPDQILVKWGVRLLTVTIAVLSAAGFLRYRKHHNARARRFWLAIPLLALAGLPSVAANSYGGEIIFRVFLFAIPYLAVAGAAAFFPHPRLGRPVRTGLALAATLLVLAAGFTLGNYGSEAMNYFSPAELAASSWLYRTAPAGAELVAANSNFPWGYTHYWWYTYTFMDTPPAIGKAVLRSPVSELTRLLEPGHTPASYLILTRGQAAEIFLTGEWPQGDFSRLTRTLLASSRFRVVYRNADALIFQLVPPRTSQPTPTGVLEMPPAASVHIPVAAAPVRLPRVLGPRPGTKGSQRPLPGRCLALQPGAPIWLDPASPPLPVPVPGQTRALLRGCR